PRIDRFLDRCEQVYISICLDVFAGQVAPGVSAPQPFGLSPWHVLPLLDHVLASGKACALDVVELCPRLDEDNRTARLGAALIGRSLACWRSAR
ncbi:MAG: arginase family protein, partial [Chlamydiia bacterium]|nr:arginase family protein [Chlamydiia bacterium]